MKKPAVDWTCAPACDALWSPLLAWWGAWHVWDGDTRHQARIRLVCRELAAIDTDLLRAVGRPYLRLTDARFARRQILCEYATRRLVHRVQTMGTLLGIDFVVAGGFAAWELERARETERGNDAFPRARRCTAVNDRIPRHRAWTPGDIDLFFSGDAEMALEIVQAAYQEWCATLFSARRAQVVTTHLVAYDCYEAEACDGATFRRAMAQLGLPEPIISQAFTSLERAPHSASFTTDMLQQTWRLSSTDEVLFPSEINVIHTRRPPEGVDYAHWITRHFDFVHCCVALEVASDGAWVFHAEESARRALAARRLEFNASQFRNSGTLIVTVRRIAKYHMNGFTFLGDEA